VRVGDLSDLEVSTLHGDAPVFTSGVVPGAPVECTVQVRAHGGLAEAVAELRGATLVVELRTPLRGVAPGQTLVFYRPDPDGDEVLGSATIRSAR
jgi:tRNA-uridine 2-sulfurtransferase